MATSFNQLFGPNFLQGLSPNQNPDPQILPGVQPPAAAPNALQAALTSDTDPNYQAWLQQHGIKPSEDYDTYAAFKAGIQPAANGHLDDSYKRPNHVTYSQDSLSAQQPGAPPAGKWIDQGGGKWAFQASPTNIQNAGGVDQMKRYFDANEKGNTVVLPNGESYVGGSGAAAAPQPSVNPGAPGQPDLGQPAAMPQSVMPAHGERKSFASVLQSLSDKVNTSFGSPTTAQMQQAHQLAIQSAQLKNLGQNLENTGTGLDNQTKAGVLLHGYFNGLKAIQTAGGDPAIAAPVLAQQLGIPVQQAQHIVESIKADPNNLDALIEATDVQKGGSASKALGLAYTTAIGPDGKAVFLQPGADGKPHPIVGYTPILGTTNTDTGAEVITRDRAGRVVARETKQGGPATGEGAIKDKNGNIVGYHPLPGSIASTNQQKTQAEIEAIKNKPVAGTKGAAPKGDPAQAMGILNNIEAGFNDLHKMGALAGDPGNGVEQAASALGRTKIGQAVGAQFGNAAAQKRLELNKNVNLLQQELIKALPASATRSRFEQEIMKASLPDPAQMSYPTAMRVISQYREIYNRAVKDAAAAPAAPSRTPKPAASGGWGKAQVVQ